MYRQKELSSSKETRALLLANVAEGFNVTTTQ